MQEIPQHAYRVTCISVLGDIHWSLRYHHPSLGWVGPPDYQGIVRAVEVHTERPEEVLSYIANEIGAVDPAS